MNFMGKCIRALTVEATILKKLEPLASTNMDIFYSIHIVEVYERRKCKRTAQEAMTNVYNFKYQSLSCAFLCLLFLFAFFCFLLSLVAFIGNRNSFYSQNVHPVFCVLPCLFDFGISPLCANGILIFFIFTNAIRGCDTTPISVSRRANPAVPRWPSSVGTRRRTRGRDPIPSVAIGRPPVPHRPFRPGTRRDSPGYRTPP